MRGKNSKVNRKSIYLTSLIIIIIVLLLWLFLSSFFLPLEKIFVMGNSHFSQDEVLSLLSHLQGKSLNHITMKALSSSLSKISWIERFEAYKIPPHTLLLRIKERTPFLLVYYDDKFPFLVDEEGYLLDKSPTEYSLPKLYVEKIKMEKPNKLPSKMINGIKEILDELKGTPASADKIFFSQDGDVQIITQKGLKIIIGKPNMLYQKSLVLKMLWGRIPNIEDRLLYIDLSSLPAVAIMKKEENK